MYAPYPCLPTVCMAGKEGLIDFSNLYFGGQNLPNLMSNL